MAYPAFYVTKTLLGGKPDINRRQIYAEDTQTLVKVYNSGMKVWTCEMEAEVNRDLAALNEIAGWPKKIAANGLVMHYGPKRRDILTT